MWGFWNRDRKPATVEPEISDTDSPASEPAKVNVADAWSPECKGLISSVSQAVWTAMDAEVEITNMHAHSWVLIGEKVQGLGKVNMVAYLYADNEHSFSITVREGNNLMFVLKFKNLVGELFLELKSDSVTEVSFEICNNLLGAIKKKFSISAEG